MQVLTGLFYWLSGCVIIMILHAVQAKSHPKAMPASKEDFRLLKDLFETLFIYSLAFLGFSFRINNNFVIGFAAGLGFIFYVKPFITVFGRIRQRIIKPGQAIEKEIHFINGNKYFGGFINGEFIGQGIMTYANGDKYIGEFKNNRINGIGIMTYANGDKYVGEFKNGEYNGKGVISRTDGVEYTGMFKDGKFHGKGLITIAGGGKYVGDFKNGQLNGQGTMTLVHGDKMTGKWKNNEFVG